VGFFAKMVINMKIFLYGKEIIDTEGIMSENSKELDLNVKVEVNTTKIDSLQEKVNSIDNSVKIIDGKISNGLTTDVQLVKTELQFVRDWQVQMRKFLVAILFVLLTFIGGYVWNKITEKPPAIKVSSLSEKAMQDSIFSIIKRLENNK